MPMNANDATDRAQDAIDQIARLRDQVEALIRDKVVPAVEDAAERAEAARETVRVRANELAGAVRNKPLTAIFAAVAIGFLLGRASR
jgi:ElaB/YqjD/DUF883 family membrane-anchored ribosome-binding protein